MTVPIGKNPISFDLDRSRPMPLGEQISGAIRAAILDKRLAPGSRLPSWQDLATQLGVSRGTVKGAYERLADEALVVSAGAAGTRVSETPPRRPKTSTVNSERPYAGLLPAFYSTPLPFQMGVPAQDAFPAKIWARHRTRAVRADAMASVGQIDPRGHPELRSQIASYLAIARGLQCDPDQVILTAGYRSGLAMVIRALGLGGSKVWIEEPGYPFTKKGLELDGMELIPVPVDGEGIDVEQGIRACKDAPLVVVTPGQQAPTGAAMSPSRRAALLGWAARSGAWIIEDDYLSELQLSGRAMPALASEPGGDRVIHIGSFGKTMSPALGLGFVVAPLELVGRLWEIATYLQPAPNTTTQLALAGFIADGHYLRHLRHMKALYSERRDDLRKRLGDRITVEAMSGLAVMIKLPPTINDVALVRSVVPQGIAPMPLSIWWSDRAKMAPGLLLGVTNLRPKIVDAACATLEAAIASSN